MLRQSFRRILFSVTATLSLVACTATTPGPSVPTLTGTVGQTEVVAATDGPQPTPTATVPRPVAGQWVQVKSMPDARSEMPVIAVNNLIYVSGGFGRTPGGLANGYGAVTRFEVYDPAQAVWHSLAPMPEPRHHQMVTDYNNQIYVFGGFDDPWLTKVNAWRYDIGADSWADLGQLPQPRTAGAAVTLGRYIYILGGTGSPASLELPVLRYDPANDQWAEVAPMQQPREHTSAVVLNGKIYVMGGRWTTGTLDSMEIYDPATNTWAWAPPMHHERAGFGAAVLDGKIYVAGGELIDTLMTLKSVEVFDPTTNAWSDLPDLPAKLHGVPAAAVNGLFYVLGGSGRSADVINWGRIFVYKP